LNYALSLNRPSFIYILVGVLLWQSLGMFLFGRDSLMHMTLVMVSAALIGNLGGFVTTWFTVATPKLAVAPASQN